MTFEVNKGNRENIINEIKKYIEKNGAIRALRVSSAKPVTKDKMTFYYYGIVLYIITLNKSKNKLIAKPLDRANRNYTSLTKAEKIAKSMANKNNFLYYISEKSLKVDDWSTETLSELLKFIKTKYK
jgi:hypothetical protein